MNDDTDIGAGGDVVVCPECGENVRITARTGMPRRGWVWILPKAIVALMILGVFALSLPGIRSSAGIGFSARSWTTPRMMVGVATPDPAILLCDVRAMRDGDKQLRHQIIDTLGKKLRNLDDMLWEGRVRFVGVEPMGFSQEVSDYGLFVSGCRVQSSSVLSDVLNPASWDVDRATPVLPGVSFWPYGYMKQISAHDHAYTRSIWFDYIDVVAVIASCWLVVWVLGLVLARCGMRPRHPRGLAVLVILGLLGVYVGVSALYPSHQHYLMVVGEAHQSSGWIAYETLMDEIESSESESELNEDGQMWEALAAVNSANPESGFLLGLQFDIGHDTDTTWWWVNLGSLIELCSGSTDSMMRRDDSADETVVETPVEFGRGIDIHLENGQSVVMKWTDNKQVRTIRIEPMTLALLLASVLWIWKLSHWAVRVWVDRQTRHRVQRNQCIFCAYPLSEEARIARSSDIRT